MQAKSVNGMKQGESSHDSKTKGHAADTNASRRVVVRCREGFFMKVEAVLAEHWFMTTAR